MTVRIRGLSPWLVAVGLVLVLASQSLSAQKGQKISVRDDPSLKNGSPELVLIEVSDFQCPACYRGTTDVMPQVYEKFVRPGKLEIIYLDFPLQMHPHAFKASEAAACAGDQQRFWDMHDKLFENQNGLSPEKLPGYAEELGLDMAAFQKCLSSGKKAPGIREDMRVAQNLGISSTPRYLLGRRIPGGDKVQILDIIEGAKKYEVFEEKINALLPSK